MTEPSHYILSFRLTSEERDQLLAFAERQGRAPYAAVVRAAIQEYLDRHRGERIEGCASVSETRSATPLNVGQ
jgi:hypothetical protein